MHRVFVHWLIPGIILTRAGILPTCNVDAAAYLSDAHKRSIREWPGEGIIPASIGLGNTHDLIRDLDQALRGQTLRGMIGPLAYNILKKKQG